jgi:hypothetical protein
MFTGIYLIYRYNMQRFAGTCGKFFKAYIWVSSVQALNACLQTFWVMLKTY